MLNVYTRGVSMNMAQAPGAYLHRVEKGPHHFHVLLARALAGEKP